MPLSSLNLVVCGFNHLNNDRHCDFTATGEIWSRGTLPKVSYQSRIFVGMLGENRQEMLVGNNYHPT